MKDVLNEESKITPRLRKLSIYGSCQNSKQIEYMQIFLEIKEHSIKLGFI